MSEHSIGVSKAKESVAGKILVKNSRVNIEKPIPKKILITFFIFRLESIN